MISSGLALFVGKLFRGGLISLFLFFGVCSLARADEPLTAPNTPPEKWLEWILNLEQDSQQIQNFILNALDPYHDALVQTETHFPIEQNFLGPDNSPYKISIDLANIPVEPESSNAFDHMAELQRQTNGQPFEKIAEVLWQSQKTGALPGPEESLIQATLQRNNEIQHFEDHAQELLINGAHYYKSQLKFAVSDSVGKPIQRGIAEIFQDVQAQRVKISTSLIEGSADLLPTQMMQLNLQAVVGPTGYIFLRQDQSDPTRVPKNQRQFCRNPQGSWVNANSREWDENCLILFDKSEWHGFSYSSLPSTYKSFLD